MSRPNFGLLRWRLLAANLTVALVAVIAVAGGVWLAAPRAFEAAMGGMGMNSGMMGSGSGMMDPVIRGAFGDAVGTALILGLAAAVTVAVLVSVLLAARISWPVSDLAASSRRLAKGDYASRVRVTSGEVGELARSFNEMAAELAATEQRRRDLIGDVAHELRTPIASVRGYVEGLQAGVFQPGPDAWHVLDEQTARLAHLVDDLAVLWRAESRDLRLQVEVLDGPALLAEARERHRALAGSRSIELRISSAAATTVRADRTRLAQVMDNLVGNALRYTPSGGHVALGLAVNGQWAVLTVQDDGPGLSEEQASHVFDRFYRADRSRSREAGGSGLGLAISRSLVEAMGGVIGVTSAGPGAGAVFDVRLPRG